MKLKVYGEQIGIIITNRSLTIEEAMWAIGYDINNDADLERGFNNGIAGFYIDDNGDFQFDYEAAQMEY